MITFRRNAQTFATVVVVEILREANKRKDYEELSEEVIFDVYLEGQKKLTRPRTDKAF